MRWFFAFLTLPLLARPPLQVQLSEAFVTWGAGCDPKGKILPAHFEARVVLEGSRCPSEPILRVWRVKIGDFPSLDNPGAGLPPIKKIFHLKHTVSPEKGGTLVLKGTWPGAPEPEDRLVVEVRWGGRRGWTSSKLVGQSLHVIRKRPGQLGSDEIVE